MDLYSREISCGERVDRRGEGYGGSSISREEGTSMVLIEGDEVPDLFCGRSSSFNYWSLSNHAQGGLLRAVLCFDTVGNGNGVLERDLSFCRDIYGDY